MKSYRICRGLTVGCVLSVLAAISLDAQTIAITGGKVYPVSGPPIEGGTVVISNGKITAVGANVAIPAGAQRIDATGKVVTPGFINSSTQLGVVEVGAVSDTRDIGATGKDNIAAAFTVWEGLNPNSVILAPARKEGITSFVVMPAGGRTVFIDDAAANVEQWEMPAPVAAGPDVEEEHAVILGPARFPEQSDPRRATDDHDIPAINHFLIRVIDAEVAHGRRGNQTEPER